MRSATEQGSASERPATGSNSAARRGIVLLFVLALLALFSLVTVTFVLVSKQSKQSAASSAAAERYGNPWQSHLENAALQAIRGTNGKLSVLQNHSLLEDKYGSEAVLGTVVNGFDDLPAANGTPLASPGQPPSYPAINGAAQTQVQKFLVRLDATTSAPLLQYNGAYAGRTATMLTGSAAGVSTRVLESTVTAITTPTAVGADPSYGLTHIVDVVTFGAPVAVGDRVLINGAPFNGTGFGYGFDAAALPTAPPTLYLGAFDQVLPLTAADTTLRFPYALLPNPVFFRPNMTDTDTGMIASVAPWYTDASGPGGADEPYDAVDYQNMIMALYEPGALAAGRAPVALPSLHRPELIFYWAQKTGAWTAAGLPPVDAANPMNSLTAAQVKLLFQNLEGSVADGITGLAPGLLRRIMLRPNPIDHPDFTGSNPNFNPCSIGSLTDMGRWDVDNDQDGVCDSIWVDLGAPVQTAPDGRKYKPLFALLVIDEDSRLNVNAAGSLAHIRATGGTPPTEPINVRDATQGFRAGPYAGNWTGISPTGTPGVPYLPIGQGYGPADINLAFVFDPPTGASNYATMRNEYGLLLMGGGPAGGTTYTEGRYGESWVGLSGVPPTPGINGAPTLTAGDWFDDFVRTGDMPDDYFNVQGQTGGDSNPGTPPPTYPIAGLWPRYGSWGSPADLNGNSFLGVDLRGQPWYGDVFARYSGGRTFTGFGEWTSATNNDKVDDPYELDLSWSGRQKTYLTGGGALSTVDRPFSPGDLERLRRFNDVDASSLASRLATLAPETFVNGVNGNALDAAYRRNLVTTESWDTPVSSTIMTPDLTLLEFGKATTPETSYTSSLYSGVPVNSGTQLSFVEMVRRRLSQANATGATYLQNYQATAIPQLVSWDLARGERLDINRLLGDGIDGNPSTGDTNNTVDDPAEAVSLSGERLWNAMGATPLGTPRPDLNNDGVSGLNQDSTAPLAERSDALARQLLARHLYVLAWSVIEPNPSSSSPRDGLRPLVNETLAPSVATPTTALERDKIRAALARRLAQWAVNMVDFRDRDSIMTGFEFDIDPFNDADGDGRPWDVDDDLTTVEATNTASGVPIRSVVWGCERPELLITETLATHDVRTQDGSSEGDAMAPGKANPTTAAMDPDTDYDQTRRPVGTLIFELYAPWNITEGAAPELYTFAPDPTNLAVNIWQLDLARRAPGTSSPVWRVAIVERSPKFDRPPEDKPYLPSPENTECPDIQRVVYFADPGATPPTDCAKLYHPSATSAMLLRPNSYAVAGPEDIGLAGRTLIKAKGAGSDVTINYSPFSVSIGAGTLAPPYPTAGTQMKAPLGIMIDQPRRLSISEPYPGSHSKYDGWHAQMAADLDVPPTVINDIPWDSPTSPELNTDMPAVSGTTPLGPDVSLETNAHRTLILQRLADPTRVWDAQTNPYISVDRMPVDLTVYNSLETTEDPTMPAAANDYKFGSRQRGTVAIQALTGGTPQVDIWSNRWVGAVPAAVPTPTTPGKDIEQTTLGYLNDISKMYNLSGTTIATTPRPWRRLVQTPVDVNYEAKAPVAYGNEFIGDPEFPFPWFTWNNRPYVSKHELLLAPALGPGELLSRHAIRTPPPASATTADRSPYFLAGLDAVSGTFNAKDIFTGLQFGYVSPLLMSGWVVQNGDLYSVPNFHRLLEFVTVPSRFAGTETYLSPTTFSAQNAVATPPQPVSGHRFNPPFNRISELREPGKLNINTITDQKVWQAVMNLQFDGTPGALAPSTVSWLGLLASRRGSGQNVPAGGLLIDPALPPQSVGGLPLPTYFANPFRSYAGLYLQPLPELQTVNYAIAPTPPAALAHPSGTGVWQNEIDSTLLRANPSTYIGGTPRPLFSTTPLMPADYMPFADSLANPYFHYQSVQKLSNLVTTRSNVYAMWITVGYFEVKRCPADGTIDAMHPAPLGWQGHPDGWQLGPEMGIDTGTVERHRAFYLIDRSIPVGFQRGEDNNVQQSILIKRMIE